MFKLSLSIMFFLMGIKVKHIKHSIYDMIPEYKNSQKNNSYGVAVSNHSSFLDVFYLFMRNFAFLAKAAIEKVPIIGSIAINRQCVFVDRDSAKQKS